MSLHNLLQVGNQSQQHPTSSTLLLLPCSTFDQIEPYQMPQSSSKYCIVRRIHTPLDTLSSQCSTCVTSTILGSHIVHKDQPQLFSALYLIHGSFSSICSESINIKSQYHRHILYQQWTNYLSASPHVDMYEQYPTCSICITLDPIHHIAKLAICGDSLIIMTLLEYRQ